MKASLYSIRDEAMGEYQTPFVAINPAVAIRNFRLLALDTKTTVGMTRRDFDLFEIGTFDSETGIIDACAAPVWLINAADAIKPASGGNGEATIGDEARILASAARGDPALDV